MSISDTPRELTHLEALTALDLDGVIVGRALYDGAVSVAGAVEVLQR